MRIGIDLGGTKIAAVALDGSREIARLRMETPRGDYPGTVDAIAQLVETIEAQTGLRGTVGIGIPGTLSPATGLVKNANSTWLIGQPLLQDLQRRLSRDVRIANDANCLAASEAGDGAVAGAAIVFAVIVGTGTGAGIAINGQVVTGLNAVAGEWGHNPLPWPRGDENPGPACYCGRHGCIETFLSGPGLAADFERQSGRREEPPGIVALAAQGDARAEAALVRYEERMARALASIINVLDPDAIVLAGGMSNLDRLYQHVPGLWGPFVFSDTVITPLVRAKHGDSSGVRGAAWLWPA